MKARLKESLKSGAWVSIVALRERLGVSRDSLGKHLRAMADDDLVERRETNSADGSLRPNTSEWRLKPPR